jgi:hypothetical protein
MPAISALPSPPSTADPTNFATKADAFISALPQLVTEINAVVQALPFAVAKWVTGTTYALGDLVWSPANYHTYRRSVAGAGATDPASDATNWAPVAYSPPTQQKFLIGTGATYTTPTGARQLRIRMKAGGGGGSGSGSTNVPGVVGGNSSFNSVNAAGGGGGNNFSGYGGNGGGGGAGVASFRLSGAYGTTPNSTIVSATNANGTGGTGGGSGGGRAAQGGEAGLAGTANMGGGGGGGGTASATFAVCGSVVPGPGGGEGEYVELVINSPAASYVYTVGPGGTAGAAGTSGYAGGAGGSGFIIVDEIY